MKKVKEFFKKIGAYIKNTAWIQPILIVIVIFVILFSLNPLTAAIKKGWTNLTSVNKMEKITYQEYVEKVYAAEEDFVVVFVTKGSEVCADLYDSMNQYLKSDAYKSAEFKVYCVDLSTKSVKKEINGRKYEQYKDSSCGIVSATNIQSNDVLALDHVKALDNRIEKFVQSFGSTTYTDIATYTDQNYTYVVSPLFVWYQDGMETRVSNNWSVDTYSSASAFNTYISTFEKDGLEADNWDEEFNLTFAE